MYRQVHDGIIWFKVTESFKFSYWYCYFITVCFPNSSYVETWNKWVNLTSSCKWSTWHAIKICPSAEILLRNAILLVFIKWIYIKISKLLFVLVNSYVHQSAQPTSRKSDWFLVCSVVAEPISSVHLYLSYYFCTSDTWKRHLAAFSQLRV